MSRQAVERLIGKMMTNDAFREKFLRDPQSAAHAEGFHLTNDELQGLDAAKDILSEVGGSLSDYVQGPTGAGVAAFVDIHV